MGDDPGPGDRVIRSKARLIEGLQKHMILWWYKIPAKKLQLKLSLWILFLEKFNLIYETLYSHRFALLRAL